jgi:hypothetical protein
MPSVCPGIPVIAKDVTEAIGSGGVSGVAPGGCQTVSIFARHGSIDFRPKWSTRGLPLDRRGCARKSLVEWAVDGQGATVEHMRVDHGCFDVFVTE